MAENAFWGSVCGGKSGIATISEPIEESDSLSFF
tara:strand:- start:11 stop:112 length:102 start_codon:yes stop_codon:yes gene_type:complete